jgi:hypothetical protein
VSLYCHSFIRSFTLAVAHLSTRSNTGCLPSPSRNKDNCLRSFGRHLPTIHLRYSLVRSKAVPQFKKIHRVLKTFQHKHTQLYPPPLIGRKIPIPRRNVSQLPIQASCARYMA